MPRSRPQKAVDVDYATTGPNQKTLRQAIDAPAADLFRCLADGPAWKEWLGIDVEWTSPEPFGVGTTRTVKGTGGVEIDEYFLAWDEGERMNFRFDSATLPVTAFAEDYRVVETSPTTSELHWSYAYEWNAPLAPVTGRAFALFFATNGKRSLKKLAALMATSGTRFKPEI